MSLGSAEDGWICSRMEGAMMHKNVEIRAKWENVTKEGKKSWIRGWRRLYDVGRIGREVLQVFYTLFSKTERTKTRKTRDLAILT